MTPEEQRIAIAEWCGWTDIPQRIIRAHTRDLTWLGVPDYLGDLNAMHEAELKLDYKQRVIFINFLAVAVVREHKPTLSDMTRCIHVQACHATAAQRAEALLRTIGKWKE